MLFEVVQLLLVRPTRLQGDRRCCCRSYQDEKMMSRVVGVVFVCSTSFSSSNVRHITHFICIIMWLVVSVHAAGDDTLQFNWFQLILIYSAADHWFSNKFYSSQSPWIIYYYYWTWNYIYWIIIRLINCICAVTIRIVTIIIMDQVCSVLIITYGGGGGGGDARRFAFIIIILRK